MYSVEDVMQQTGLNEKEAKQLIADAEQKEKEQGREHHAVLSRAIEKVKNMSKEEWEQTFESPYPG